jgi:hypothetical protein
MNRPSTLPYYTLITGIAVIVIVAGFVGGVILFGVFGDEVRASGVGVPAPPIATETPIGGNETPAPDGRGQGETTPQPAASATAEVTATATATATATPVPPTATPVPPTATPVPPTPTPAPTIIYHDIFRAEGGDYYRSTSSSLPLRRVEATWNNCYKECTGTSDRVRGRLTANAMAGPFTIAERLEASAMVYNTFTAQGSDAELEMDIRWKGNMIALAGADSHASVTLTVNVFELDSNGRVVRAVPGLPYTVMEEEIGSGLQGYDSIAIEDSRSITIPMRLQEDKTYRIELELTCSARAALSGSVTGCDFSGGSEFAEWTAMRVAFYP